MKRRPACQPRTSCFGDLRASVDDPHSGTTTSTLRPRHPDRLAIPCACAHEVCATRSAPSSLSCGGTHVPGSRFSAAACAGATEADLDRSRSAVAFIPDGSLAGACPAVYATFRLRRCAGQPSPPVLLTRRSPRIKRPCTRRSPQERSETPAPRPPRGAPQADSSPPPYSRPPKSSPSRVRRTPTKRGGSGLKAKCCSKYCSEPRAKRACLRTIRGLGHGLDENAVAAANANPLSSGEARRCGRRLHGRGAHRVPTRLLKNIMKVLAWPALLFATPLAAEDSASAINRLLDRIVAARERA